MKEALFGDQEVARAVTRFFVARQEAQQGVALDVQLRPDTGATSALEARLGESLRATLQPRVKRFVELYRSGEYPQPTTHERKHHYLGR